MTPGEHLRERREELGLSAAEVARRCGVCRESIWLWESDRKAPGLHSLSRIVEGYQLNAGQLLALVDAAWWDRPRNPRAA